MTGHVFEVFDSFQGTGVNTGVRQLTVRLSGCSIPCPIRSVCDEAEALDPSAGQPLASVINTITNYVGDWVQISGGEPLSNATSVLEVAKAAGLRSIQLQTSGGFDLPAPDFPCFVTCSPKVAVGSFRLSRVDEFVFVAHSGMTLSYINSFVSLQPKAPVFILPLFGDSSDRASVLVKGVKGARLGIQAHKYWQVK